jgi:Flp pilus assembly protein TadG
VRPTRSRPGSAADRGSVTVETAIGIGLLAVVLAMCLAGIGCAVAAVRCTDAAREGARLAARDDPDAAEVARRMAPADAQVGLERTGDTVTVTVAAAPLGGLLPGVRVSGRAVAAVEDEGDPSP